jgi:hypothetical protein
MVESEVQKQGESRPAETSLAEHRAPRRLSHEGYVASMRFRWLQTERELT